MATSRKAIWIFSIAAIAFISAFVLLTTVVSANGLPCGCGDLCVNETGWWRDGGAFNASDTPIQAAVDNATAGETICVQDGTYNENVDVNVAHITIRSENGSANCFVNAAYYKDYVFSVTSDWVNISGFTVQNAPGSGKAGIYLNHVDHCTISENTASDNDYGIYLSSSSNNTLTSNTANSNSAGIRLYYSSNNTLTSNTANSNNYYGIYLLSSGNNTLAGNTANSNNFDGIMLESSGNNTLAGNTANSNNFEGLNLHSSSNNTLTSNTASNNYYGIYLYYESSSNNLTGNTASNNYYGIFFGYSCSNNNLTGNTASNNYYGIYLVYLCSDNNLTDNTASNNYYGIYLNNSCPDNNLTDNTASNNDVGIYLSSSSTNNLTDNTASNNNYGIYLSSSGTNNLTSNTANSNSAGIFLHSSSCNSLTGNTVNSNGYFGIYLSSSSNNKLTGNIASNNYDGIILQFSSTNNNLTGNTVNSNNYHGISLQFSSNNHIYNNYFNNTQNAYDNGNNVWNITKTEGRNIIGGPNLGGNYWSDYTGTDADGDGLGDTPYAILGGTNKDYLPLVAIAAPHIFDTGQGTYPSIRETHNGTIKLNQTITVSKLYTYPCPGTGGHTKSFELYENDTLIANGTWNGYQGDWHNITITPSVTLWEDREYRYIIETGSYPQVIHASSTAVTGGTITCTSFEDVNGITYTDWIPAIRLWEE